MGKLAIITTKIEGESKNLYPVSIPLGIIDPTDNVPLSDVLPNIKDKEYNVENYSGLGRRFLKKNVVNDVNVLSQDMLPNANTRYIIQYDYDLLGAEITIPDECVLDFQGGSLSNGTIVGTNTVIISSPVKIFSTDITTLGVWNVQEWYVEWFGAKGDGVADDTDAFDTLLKMKDNIAIKLLNKTYNIRQLNLSSCRYVSIVGSNSAPTHTAGAFSPTETTIRAISEVDVLVKARAESDDEINTIGFGFYLANLNIDGNNLATTGVLCSYEVQMRNVQVLNCYYGIETSRLSYPILLEYVYCRWNQIGLYIHGPNTTVLNFKNCEFQFNRGWGIYITEGAGLRFADCLVQANWVGGIKIEQFADEPESGNYHWLYNLYFDNLYTEGNGRRAETDSDYEGNYTIWIKGLDTAPYSYLNKIANILFINCCLNTTGKLAFVEGTYGLQCINCSNPIVPDRTKNCYSYQYISRIRSEAIELKDDAYITFPTDTNHKLNYFKYFWKKIAVGTYTRPFTIVDEINCWYQRIGFCVYLYAKINYTDHNQLTDQPLMITDLPYYSIAEAGSKFLAGTIEYTDINGEVKTAHLKMIEPGNYTKVDGIYCNDLAESGSVSLHLQYFTADNTHI